MKPSLQTFLADLYEIDPALREHEAEIIPLVEKLLKSDPSQTPDERFVQSLRMQLQNRAAELSAAPSSRFSRWIFALGGAVTAAIIIPVAFVAINQKPAPTTHTDMFAYEVKQESSKAFGDLKGLSPVNDAAISARPQSGGGGGGMGMVTAVPPMSEPAMPVPAPDGGTMLANPGMDAKMIAPYPMTRYEYVYEGELKDLADSVAVFKRDPSGKTVAMSSLADNFNLGSIDVSSFADMNVDSVTFSQKKSYGYQVTVNLREGSVYLDAMWDQWPQSKCQTDACYRAQRVKIGDVPADSVLIGIAQSFVSEHGINLSNYGEPVVDMQWKREYDRAPDASEAYIPDTIRVIYPLQVDGKDVYDQSGMKTGIAVGIHVKEKKVMNVYGIMNRTYLKSEYEGVTDAKAIKDYLSKVDNYGGIMPMYREGGDKNADVQTNTVVLGDPVVSYVQYFRYANAVSEELLIPSLVFPVKEVKGMDGASYWRTTVIVPLAKDMFDIQAELRPVPMDGGDVRAM